MSKDKIGRIKVKLTFKVKYFIMLTERNYSLTPEFEKCSIYFVSDPKKS